MESWELLLVFMVWYKKIKLFSHHTIPSRTLIWGCCFSEKFNIPVLVENESNFYILGESAFHYGYENMIHINIHDGIGMGILINEELYKGHDGYAGELGHTILFPEGKPCACGNEGCLEQYAS